MKIFRQYNIFSSPILNISLYHMALLAHFPLPLTRLTSTYNPSIHPSVPLTFLSFPLLPLRQRKKMFKARTEISEDTHYCQWLVQFPFLRFFYCVVSRDEITGHGSRCQDTPAMTLFSGVFTLTYWLPRYRILLGWNLLLTKCCERRDKLGYT